MRTLSKLVLLVIPLLTLSIFVQHNPGLCASAVEYQFTLYGEIANPAKGGIFEPAIIQFSFGPNNGGTLFIGNLSISSGTYKKTSDFTGSVNQITGDYIITTTGNASISLSAALDLCILQIPGDGISGVFTPTQPG